MRISDWSSDVCSSDLVGGDRFAIVVPLLEGHFGHLAVGLDVEAVDAEAPGLADLGGVCHVARVVAAVLALLLVLPAHPFLHRRLRIPVRALDIAEVPHVPYDTTEVAAATGLASGPCAKGR